MRGGVLNPLFGVCVTQFILCTLPSCRSHQEPAAGGSRVAPGFLYRGRAPCGPTSKAVSPPKRCIAASMCSSPRPLVSVRREFLSTDQISLPLRFVGCLIKLNTHPQSNIRIFT